MEANTEACFSSNFMDVEGVIQNSDDVATDDIVLLPDVVGGGFSTSTEEVDVPVAQALETTNPFSESDPEPAKNLQSTANSKSSSNKIELVLEIVQKDPDFNFGANLDTCDSVASLENLGICSEEELARIALLESSPVSSSKAQKENPIHSSGKHWEDFGNGSAKEQEVTISNSIGTAVNEAELSSPSKEQAESWEKFEEVPLSKSKKLLASAQQNIEGGGGTVCVADAIVSKTSQWTALGDSHGFIGLGEKDDSNLPFRKTQSMRATSSRRVQIVDHLKNQRRLSNSGDPFAGLQFNDEDDLTRKFNVDKEYNVFVKMDKKVPGIQSNWLPVNICVKQGTLVIKQSAPPTMPISSEDVLRQDSVPLHEIRFFHNHSLTTPVSRKYDKKSRIHQIKLQQSHIQERRTLRRWFLMEHVSKLQTVVKLGCPDIAVVQSLSDTINEAVRQLPITRDQGVAYMMNEVFVDVKDYSDILMNCDGAVLERKSLNRIYVQAFLTDSPECRLILNDTEALLLQGKGQMNNSMSRQVRLNHVVLHPCVDKSLYKKSREIKFRPVDGHPFELLRCAIEPYISPPIIVTALMEYSEQRSTVKITSSFSVRKKHNLKLRPIKDLLIRFPVPSSWSSLFQADTMFGGTKSVRSTAALRGSFRRKIKSNSCQILTHLGSAKYEAEYGSILWRIGHYMVEEAVPHTLRCDIQLIEGMHKPDITSEHAEISYTLPGSSTGMEIRAFKVDRVTPERWVKYEIQYHYRVQMFPDLSID